VRRQVVGVIATGDSGCSGPSIALHLSMPTS
jgi:hypothetical protein